MTDTATAHLLERIRVYVAAGMRAGEIAARLGRSVEAVRAICSVAGIALPPEREGGPS